MSNEGVNTNRRRFLTLATSVVGAGGAAAAAVPFLASMAPSERAKALGAPVSLNIENLEPGQMVTTAWRGKPVWVVNRTPEMLDTLDKVTDRLRDPESEQPQQPPYAQNQQRSIKPGILVMVGICTHLGCSPKFRPEKAPADLGENWLGGFFCPCHGSKFDLAGRVYGGVPAVLNMVIPPHHYVSETEILIGEDKETA
ncbi:ubiquinol-cytochrome c reductase iron-sulfur subunit [Algiphilus aromaticivorans]|uniref:ubiquinol-cytochrome c reductase iron-sulfur subunit n=1 Tax=Algiphilus aromaticivorans TaxID=382454 RepID=UPI0005C22344|nr:ubiquinol-cytochrome c reductase iron-sulfur subunit [Algiphilus aromaticivorans]